MGARARVSGVFLLRVARDGEEVVVVWLWRNVAAQGRIVVGVVREGKSIVLYLSQGDNESAVLACSWKQARGMRQLSARSEMGGIGFGGEGAAGFRAVTLPTPSTPPHESTSTTQFSAAPVGIGIPCVK